MNLFTVWSAIACHAAMCCTLTTLTLDDEAVDLDRVEFLIGDRGLAADKSMSCTCIVTPNTGRFANEKVSWGRQQEEKVPQKKSLPQTTRLGNLELPLVVHDDFQSGRSRWDTTDDKAWMLRTENDNKFFSLTKRMSNYKPEHRSPHNIALVKGVVFTDFVMTFSVRNPKDTGDHRDCCVFFGHRDRSNFYYAHLGARPDPNSGQVMIVNNAPRKALTANKNNVAWSNQWHQVKVTRNTSSGEIKVYFDDFKTPLMQTTDKTFEKGQVGIGSFDDMCDFDNVVLYGKTTNN